MRASASPFPLFVHILGAASIVLAPLPCRAHASPAPSMSQWALHGQAVPSASTTGPLHKYQNAIPGVRK